MASEPVYEMLWDCTFCGTQKLLGLTHRHCPVCGGPQNADARYFPPENEKVPVQNHIYYGSDVKCSACGVANSKASKHCRGCGAPLETGSEVKRQQDQVSGPFVKSARGDVASARPAAALSAMAESIRRASTRPKKSGGRGCLITGVLLFVVVVGGMLASKLWTKPGLLTVSGHRWERNVDVMRFGPVRDEAWCDAVPFGTPVVERFRKQRSSERVPDGEECVTRKVDQGDGTYTEREECKTRYRSEPVYDDRCAFIVNRWSVARTERLTGRTLGELRWPILTLAQKGQCIGCEKEGARREKLTLTFVDEKGKSHECEVSEARFKNWNDGMRVEGKLSVMTGGLSCNSLRDSP